MLVFGSVIRCISPYEASEKWRWSIWEIRFHGPKFEDILLQRSYTKKQKYSFINTPKSQYQMSFISPHHHHHHHQQRYSIISGCSQLSPKPRLMIYKLSYGHRSVSSNQSMIKNGSSTRFTPCHVPPTEMKVSIRCEYQPPMLPCSKAFLKLRHLLNPL